MSVQLCLVSIRTGHIWPHNTVNSGYFHSAYVCTDFTCNTVCHIITTVLVFTSADPHRTIKSQIARLLHANLMLFHSNFSHHHHKFSNWKWWKISDYLLPVQVYLVSYQPKMWSSIFTRDSVAIARICHGNSVCLSVRLSHGWISQKRLKLGSRNFHHTVARSL